MAKTHSKPGTMEWTSRKVGEHSRHPCRDQGQGFPFCISYFYGAAGCVAFPPWLEDDKDAGGMLSSSVRRPESGLLPLLQIVGASGRVAYPPWRGDHKDGHFQFALGENITPRYTIVSKMGQGTYGQVLECWDQEAQEYVEIKVSPNAKEFGRQLLESLAHMHERTLIHTNLKPQNVLFVSAEYVEKPHIHELLLIHTDLKLGNTFLVPSEDVKQLEHNSKPKFSEIKLIDFSYATYYSEDLCFLVSTRQYRAPEIILGLSWTYPSDMWSVGCILVELCSGDVLFPTHAQDLECTHLVVMESRLGPISQSMIRRAGLGEEEYSRHG